MDRSGYRNKVGTQGYKVSMGIEEYLELANSDTGWCVACGTEAYGVEPDAREYTCENCGDNSVYGLEELMLIGLLEIKG